MLLEHQREYLQQIKRKHYNPNLATDLLYTLFKGIASHSTDITFTEEYRVDMALTTCGYALREFQKMVENERKTNDPVEYLEGKMRGPFLNIFKDEYNQIAQEITAASGVCDLLLHSVKKEVFASLSPRIADGMKGAYDFSQSKPALKAKSLNDIGENLYENRGGSILICLHYLRSVDRSIHWWLKRYTLQYCEDKFARITSKEISRIVGRIREEVSNVSERFSCRRDDFKIMEWLTTFHSEIQKTGNLHLDVTELHQLGGVHLLKDISRFTEEVMKGLTKLEFTLREEFLNMPLAEIDNWTKKPQDYLFEDLAGCTEQCPFRKEQCDHTNADHLPSTKHSVAMHRPKCLGGYRYVDSQEMMLNVCTTAVAIDGMFKNCDTDFEYYPYKEYTKFYPQWSIAADMSLEASLYWKWLLGHHASEVAEAFEMKQPTIPREWKRLQWKDAKESLNETYYTWLALWMHLYFIFCRCIYWIHFADIFCCNVNCSSTLD